LLAEPARAGTASGVFEPACRRQDLQGTSGKKDLSSQSGKLISVKNCCFFSNKNG